MSGQAAGRGAAAFVLAVTASALWLGGGGSLRLVRTADAWAAGRARPETYLCSFRRQTGLPCLGCGGTAAFSLGARGRFGAAARESLLGGFVALAAWALAAAATVTLCTGATGWLFRVGVALLALLPPVFVVHAAVWWASLPPGALAR